jgi:hypothetical protein
MINTITYIVSARKPFLFVGRRQKIKEEREDKQTGRLSICLKCLFFLLLSFIFGLKQTFRANTLYLILQLTFWGM